MNYFKGSGFSFPLGEKTYIMGILNITPDSFYDGGRYNSLHLAAEHARLMESEGADIIDIGANSTNPNAVILSEDEELAVIKEFLIPVVKNINVPVSVDTFYPAVAEYCLGNGVSIINDVSGRRDKKMTELVKAYGAGLVVMHNPLFSSKETGDYSSDGGVVKSIRSFFASSLEYYEKAGVNKEQLLFDTGIGFAKTNADNLEVIKRLGEIKLPDTALLTALSMKRVTSFYSGAESEDRLYPTLAANVLSVSGGTDFVRVHAVKEAALSLKMADALLR